MCSKDSSHCLTRIVDGEWNVEVACLPEVMFRIQAALGNLPASDRDLIAAALLHSAVSEIMHLGASLERPYANG